MRCEFRRPRNPSVRSRSSPSSAAAFGAIRATGSGAVSRPRASLGLRWHRLRIDLRRCHPSQSRQQDPIGASDRHLDIVDAVQRSKDDGRHPGPRYGSGAGSTPHRAPPRIPFSPPPQGPAGVPRLGVSALRSRRVCAWVLLAQAQTAAGMRILPKAELGFWSGKFKQNVARDRRTEDALRDMGGAFWLSGRCETRDDMALAQRLRRFLRSSDFDVGEGRGDDSGM